MQKKRQFVSFLNNLIRERPSLKVKENEEDKGNPISKMSLFIWSQVEWHEESALGWSQSNELLLEYDFKSE